MDVRLATPADAVAVQAIYAPVVLETAISFEVEPPSVAEIAARIESTLPHHPWLVAEDGRGVVGYAYGHRFAARAAYDWSVETSVYVDAAARGSGVGRALYERLLGLLRDQGYRQAFAGIALPNAASVALHEALGFERVATYRNVGWKHGAWHDVGWWQLALAAADDTPPPPRPLT